MNIFKSESDKNIDQAASEVKRMANRAHDAVDSGVDKMRTSAKELVNAAKEGVDSGTTNVENAAKSFMDTVQAWLDQGKKTYNDVACQAKEHGSKASAACESYIKEEPFKAMGIAAAAGAALGALYILTRRR